MPMMDGGGAAVFSAHSLYLPPSCINISVNNLGTHAAKAPQPFSQSNPPASVSDCMVHTSKQPPCTVHDQEKDAGSTMTASGDEALESSLKHSEPAHPEANNQTVGEKRLLRSRALRLSSLYKPAHHIDHDDTTTPPPCTPVFSTLFQDAKEQGESSSTPLQSSSFQKFRDFRHALHLSRLLPDVTFSPFDTPSFWLALYFALNLSLTLYNKSVLIHFPFPYTLTALHALCGTIGASLLLCLQDSAGSGTPMNGTTRKSPWSLFHKITPDLSPGELIVLLLFSMLYTINIVVSNASLRLVTVPFHQVVRASTPFFTIVFSLILLSKRCSKLKVLTLIPVVAGVCFATYGDYYFTPIGFFLTLLGTLLAALKTILTNVILVKHPTSPLPFSSESPTHSLSDDAPSQPSSSHSLFSNLLSYFYNSSSSSPAANTTNSSIKTPVLSSFTLPKLSLSPLHLLYLLSPLAFIQTTLLAHLTGELNRVQFHLFHSSSSTHPEGGTLNFRIWLVSNGVLAFLLNIVSFHANRRVGPLAMTVAANVKQVLTVLCAVFIFDLTITPANALGIVLTIAGGALYAAVELQEKQNRRRWFR